MRTTIITGICMLLMISIASAAELNISNYGNTNGLAIYGPKGQSFIPPTTSTYIIAISCPIQSSTDVPYEIKEGVGSGGTTIGSGTIKGSLSPGGSETLRQNITHVAITPGQNYTLYFPNSTGIQSQHSSGDTYLDGCYTIETDCIGFEPLDLHFYIWFTTETPKIPSTTSASRRGDYYYMDANGTIYTREQIEGTPTPSVSTGPTTLSITGWIGGKISFQDLAWHYIKTLLQGIGIKI